MVARDDAATAPPFLRRRGWPMLVCSLAIIAGWCVRLRAHNDTCADSPRSCAGRALLRALQHAGATASVRLDVREGADGLGVFVDEPVAAGSALFELPRRLWLQSANGGHDGLPLALGRERRAPSAPHLAAFVRSLPTECPPNLAARHSADINLVGASLVHAWMVRVWRADVKVLDRELPEANSTERTLLLCLKMSRAFNDLTEEVGDDDEAYPSVMLPFVDLLNHRARRTVREVFDAKRGSLMLLAARDLAVGDELVFPYREAATQAQLLLGFGFRATSDPVATLQVDGAILTEHESAFLARHGCAGEGQQQQQQAHIPLHIDVRSGELGEPEMRAGLHCLRLRTYSFEEAAWAVATGYLDRSLLATRASFSEADSQAYDACVRKDAYVVYNTIRSCEHALGEWTEEEVELYADADEAAGVSEDVRQVVYGEIVALRACGEVGGEVLNALEARGSGLQETLRNSQEGEEDGSAEESDE